MDANRSSDSSRPEQEKSPMAFFHDGDLSSIPSDLSSGSSRSSSLFEKSFSFRKRGKSKETVAKDGGSYLMECLKAWSNFKPSCQYDCLPYDDILTANNPFMALSPFRPECESSFSNFISLLANSARREMADMFVYILPSLIERSVNQLSREECQDFRCWWNAFAEYLFTVLTTIAKALRLQHRAASPYLKELDTLQHRDLIREFNRTMERLTVTSEIPMKAMQKKVRSVAERFLDRCLVDVEEMWYCLSNFVLQTLDDSYHVARSFERKTRTFMPSGLQEKLLQGMLSPPVRSADTQDYAANIIISLTRWMRDEEVVMQFVIRFFKKKVERNMNAYCYRYVNRRRIFRFQCDRKPNGMPKKKEHKPSRVTFSVP